MRWWLPVVLSELFASVLCAGSLLELSPSSERLPVTGVPFLNEEVAEVYTDEEGLWLVPGDSLGWVRTAAESSCIELVISVDREEFDYAVVTIWNWHNHPIRQERLVAAETHRVALKIEGRGSYLVTLDGFRGDECIKRLVRSFSFTEDLNFARQTWKIDEFFLGVCAFPGRYHWSYEGKSVLPPNYTEAGARELEASLLARLGFQVVRTDESMEMGVLEVEGKPEYRFDFERMDEAIRAYTSRGFELALQLMNAPDWAVAEKYRTSTEGVWRYPRAEAPQVAYVRALVNRYGRQARFFQVFNEPDQVAFWAGTPAEYLQQYAYTAAAIRDLYPDKPIVNGGYSLVDRAKTALYIRELDRASSFAAYHSHGDLTDLMEDISEMRRLYKESGVKSPRLVNTEMGYDGWRLDQERRKGEIVPQKVLHCWATGHAGVLVFGGRMTLGPEQVSQDFGFLDYQFCPRFVYGSLAGLVGTLEGASFDRIVLQSEDVFVYQFLKDGRKLIAAFSLSGKAAVRWKADAAPVEVVDEMGNRNSVVLGKDDLLQFSSYPRYWIFAEDIEIGLSLANEER